MVDRPVTSDEPTRSVFRRSDPLAENSAPAKRPSDDLAELEKVYARMGEETLAFYKRILEQYRPLPIDELAGTLAPPVSRAQIEQWREAGRIFSVSFEGKELYPTFLFENGRPKEVVARVLQLLREDRPPSEAEMPYSEWSTLCWFVGANAWLEGQRPLEGETPVNQMDSNPDAVVCAASHARDRISD